jgi:aminopeptidase-like protein
MIIDDLIKSLDYDEVGKEIYALIEELFPICRSITGNGVRETLKTISKHIPLEIHEIPNGTKVFDWIVPKEWNIRDAYVKDSKGRKIIDFKQSNLHVLNYSVPVNTTLPLEELRPHLFTKADYPDWIPYKTSYYKENWGFCLSHNQYLSMGDGDYNVVIDSTLADGHLTYAECVIPGESKMEILISTHICHPSLANDNLSGVCSAVFLAKHLGKIKSRYSYRFLFIPGTIGAITWLSLNLDSVDHIKNGLVLTGVGDSGKITYKKSRRGNAEIDRIAKYVLATNGRDHNVIEFSPYGYDERQYCSPGFDLPVGRFSRTPFGEYPQYHTSADNLDFVQSDALADSFSAIVDILFILEHNISYINKNPMCEPQLGKRGLYNEIGDNEMAMLWVLNFSDGTHSLLEIAQKSNIPFESILQAANLLRKHGLIEECKNTSFMFDQKQHTRRFTFDAGASEGLNRQSPKQSN